MYWILFIFIRGGEAGVAFSDIVFRNYALDGGLFVPESVPKLSRQTVRSWSALSYQDLCVEVISLFVNREMRSALPEICAKCYSQSEFPTNPIIPIKQINGIHLLELFHGKTLAFKDFSLNLVANIMQYLMERRSETANIVVHTHGDTGR